ncbi:MAG: four helix bundle protein [Acidobacteriota bacterium]|nr:four helix bundle protein [Acidobacteriota bacterium]
MARPAYKDHPLWSEAMALARDAYALAGRVKEAEPDLARNLKKASVAVPAQVAGALEASPERRRDHVAAARGALAELSRLGCHAREAGVAGAGELVSRAEDFARSVLFALGAGEFLC